MKSELLARTEAEAKALNCDVWQAAGDSTSDYLPHATGWPKQNIYYMWHILYNIYEICYDISAASRRIPCVGAAKRGKTRVLFLGRAPRARRVASG